MRGAKTIISSLLFAAAALAQVPDYFPLQQGNVWIYRTRGMPRPADDTITVEVTDTGNFNGRTYYLVVETRRGRNWLRNDGAGRVYRYNEARGEEQLWFDFSRKTGETYPTAVPSCCGQIEVVSTAASKQVPLGDFENAFYRLTYPGVFQVGVTEENFLPYVGLVFRSENVGGPGFRVQDLVYAKIGGTTVLNASGLGFGLARAKGYARAFVNNNTGAPLRILLFGRNIFDVTIRDAGGAQLYRQPDGDRVVIQALDLPPGETSWPIRFPEDIPDAATLSVEMLTLPQRFSATLPLQTGSPSRP